MTPDVPVTDALLHALPKTDLHCHLDGSLRLRTMLELAEEQKVRLPADSEEGLGRAMKIGQRHGSLEEYLLAGGLRADQLDRARSRLAVSSGGRTPRNVA